MWGLLVSDDIMQRGLGCDSILVLIRMSDIGITVYDTLDCICPRCKAQYINDIVCHFSS